MSTRLLAMSIRGRTETFRSALPETKVSYQQSISQFQFLRTRVQEEQAFETPTIQEFIYSAEGWQSLLRECPQAAWLLASSFLQQIGGDQHGHLSALHQSGWLHRHAHYMSTSAFGPTTGYISSGHFPMRFSIKFMLISIVYMKCWDHMCTYLMSQTCCLSFSGLNCYWIWLNF
jgi:hypothetical protein